MKSECYLLDNSIRESNIKFALLREAKANMGPVDFLFWKFRSMNETILSLERVGITKDPSMYLRQASHKIGCGVTRDIGQVRISCSRADEPVIPQRHLLFRQCPVVIAHCIKFLL